MKRNLFLNLRSNIFSHHIRANFIFFFAFIFTNSVISQAPVIDGHFCDALLWGPPGGVDGCNDATPPTADMGNLYFYENTTELYIGWQRCINGAGTSNYTIRFDTNCDGLEDSYIYVVWDAIGSSCSDTENVYLESGSNSTVITTAMQGAYNCSSGTPVCSQSGTFMEWVLDMDLVVEQLVNWGVIDPCNCTCENIELLDGVTLSGGAITSKPKDEFDIFSFSYNYEINDCPNAEFSFLNYNCANVDITFDGTLSTDEQPLNDTLYYSWDFGDGNISSDSIPVHSYTSAGNYIVTLSISDKFNCIDEISYPITINPSLVSSCQLISDIPCFGQNNGSVNVSYSGGDSNYNIIWNTGDINASLSNLPSGLYAATVTDNGNCIDTCSVFVNEPDQLYANPTIIEDIECFGDSDGVIESNPSGGTTPYNYNWSTGTTGTNTLNSLSAGSYSVTVTDSNNCSNINSVQLTDPEEILCSIERNRGIFTMGGFGAATVYSEGGTGTLNYLWSNGCILSKNDTMYQGMHYVTVSDLFSCQKVCNIELFEVVD